MLGRDLNRQIFCRAAADADLSIVEGMMGLFDGSSPTNEIGSTAELAKQLQAPVLLVVDGSAMARSAAAMVLGYARFDDDLRISGVLFNRVGGDGHYRLLKDAVESATDIPVVGYLKPDASFSIPDRHLGIVTAVEHGSSVVYESLARAASETVDLDHVEAIAHAAKEVECEPMVGSVYVSTAAGEDKIRVGVAYDPAFCFYYSENLELLKAEGAEVMTFSPLRDAVLPEVDLLYLGGGYPELYGQELAANSAMRSAIHDFATRGGTIYAECGGLMYLTLAILDFEGHRHEMVGLFPAEAVMQKSKLTLGYREFEVTRPCVLGGPGTKIRGHEFHYSSLVLQGSPQYGGAIVDAGGRLRADEGLLFANTMALYTHLHFSSQPSVARALINTARSKRGAKLTWENTTT
jgi:cobyrinic acid a,c-diamide synthase